MYGPENHYFCVEENKDSEESQLCAVSDCPNSEKARPDSRDRIGSARSIHHAYRAPPVNSAVHYQYLDLPEFIWLRFSKQAEPLRGGAAWLCCTNSSSSISHVARKPGRRLSPGAFPKYLRKAGMLVEISGRRRGIRMQLKKEYPYREATRRIHLQEVSRTALKLNEMNGILSFLRHEARAYYGIRIGIFIARRRRADSRRRISDGCSALRERIPHTHRCMRNGGNVRVLIAPNIDETKWNRILAAQGWLHRGARAARAVLTSAKMAALSGGMVGQVVEGSVADGIKGVRRDTVRRAIAQEQARARAALGGSGTVASAMCDTAQGQPCAVGRGNRPWLGDRRKHEAAQPVKRRASATRLRARRRARAEWGQETVRGAHMMYEGARWIPGTVATPLPIQKEDMVDVKSVHGLDENDVSVRGGEETGAGGKGGRRQYGKKWYGGQADAKERAPQEKGGRRADEACRRHEQERGRAGPNVVARGQQERCGRARAGRAAEWERTRVRFQRRDTSWQEFRSSRRAQVDRRICVARSSGLAPSTIRSEGMKTFGHGCRWWWLQIKSSDLRPRAD
ncbi:hypothetical protein C8J57DRAFT_1223097 [Mycena rebaudengoi]|nr:hypothetical protein C8J57DRAFT_1223097 [Mycena rebaudengoi]